jgi:hypothetical protein
MGWIETRICAIVYIRSKIGPIAVTLAQEDQGGDSLRLQTQFWPLHAGLITTALNFLLEKILKCRIVTLEENYMIKETLETRIINRIGRKRGDVFLRSDFNDLGGYDQVGRILRDLVHKGKLLKVSYGLYTRAVKSPFSERPVPPKGLETLTEALRRVGVEVVQTRLEREYNAGLTTQVPTGRVIGVRRRVRRKIGYDGINLSFENVG